ncbi:18451_t:CDS:2, partial [Racocetra persica]
EANEEFERYQSRIKRKKDKLNSNDKIVIYTDGSHKDNQKGLYAGIGVYYEDGTKKITEPLPGDLQTNNHAELYAVIRVLETCEDQLKVIEIKTDSRFVDVKNKDLFEKIDFLLTKRPGKVYFTHVFAHRGVIGNELADKLAKREASIKINESKKLSPYNAFMKTNLPIVKKTKPDLEHKDAFKLVAFVISKKQLMKNKVGSSLKNEKSAEYRSEIKIKRILKIQLTKMLVVLSKKEQFWWFRRENENTNYRRPFMFTDDEEHITEYIQIKLSDKQNALLDKERRDFLKQHKFILDKASNIIKETTKEYLLELLYEVKLANIKFKNGYSFDLRICNIEIA